MMRSLPVLEVGSLSQISLEGMICSIMISRHKLAYFSVFEYMYSYYRYNNYDETLQTYVDMGTKLGSTLLSLTDPTEVQAEGGLVYLEKLRGCLRMMFSTDVR